MSNTVAQSLTFVGSYPENILLQALSTIEFGSIRIESPWGGHHHIIGKEKGPQAEIKILSADFYDELLKKGDIGLGETYMAGQWESPDIGALIQFGIVNQQTLKRAILGSWFRLLVYRLTRLTQINFKGNAKKNIHKHYDLGNDFYQMWLDPSMTYSSAYWGDQPLLNLQEAQQKKYESILQALHAKPGDHILEIGCGWGGFAEFAASKGMKVTGITISQAQFEFATQRMKTHNLSSLVDIQLVDYRDVNGQFDHVVSIEMIEAVGKEFWESYFLKIKEVTKKGGLVADRRRAPAVVDARGE